MLLIGVVNTIAIVKHGGAGSIVLKGEKFWENANQVW